MRLKKLLWILFFTSIADVYAAAENILPQNNSTFGFVNILRWQLREGGADNWAQEFSSTSNTEPIRIVDAPFQWNNGIRIGIGQLFSASNNDIALVYTHYHTLATNTASGLVSSSFDGNYFANNTNGASLGPDYRNASIRWQFYYDTLDLNAGHLLSFNSLLQLHPYIGLKGAVINQSIFSNWNNPTPATTFTTATENLKNNFSGIGPSIGIDTTWPMYLGTQKSISLLGNFTGALLYGHWYFDDVYMNNKPVTITVHNDSINGLSPMFGGLLGLRFDNQFKNSKISLMIGYEIQMWFNQIQFYSLNGGKYNRSLTLQGIDFEFKYSI